MRQIRMSLSLAALAFAAVPLNAQTRALPAPVPARYVVPVEPCVDSPVVRPNGEPRFRTQDGDCGRVPVEPPIVRPVPCPYGDCGTPPRRPDPCWYDDCPPGRGWDGRYRLLKESAGGDDPAARQNALNAFFDNMASKKDGAGAVSAGSGGGYKAGAALTPFAPVPSRARRESAVPNPYGARVVSVADTDANPMRHENTVREAGTWGAGGAVAGSSGGVAGAAAGAVGGALSGAASGYASDLKDKQQKDDDSYRRGTDAWNKTHEDHLRRQGGK